MQLTALRIMVTGAIIVVAVRARMQVSRSFPRQEEGPRTGGNRQGEHPLHVPRHGDEGPLTLDIFEPTQQELAEAHRRFDDPEHRLRDLLAQGIELLAFGRLQTVALMASSGVGFSGADGTLAKRSDKGG